MIPLILGVGLATYGDYYFTNMGFILTFVGVVLAAIKVCLQRLSFACPREKRYVYMSRKY